jgi:hypothetical protein
MTDVQKGYETRDAHPGATIRAGLYMLGVMFLVAVFVVPLYRLFARRETREQPRPASLVREQPSVPALSFPKLVTSEPRVLAAFHRQEDELLDGYGWVEKDRGIARMPIAEAMRIVGTRGELPTFPAPAQAGAPAAGTTAGPAAGAAPPVAARGAAGHVGGAR